MPKHVSDSTYQLSVRIDTRSLGRIDKVRDILDKQTGARPQRSDIVRKAIDYGMEIYCKLYHIDVGGAAAEPAVEVASPPPPATEEPVTVPEPKKSAPAAAVVSKKKGGKKAARKQAHA